MYVYLYEMKYVTGWLPYKKTVQVQVCKDALLKLLLVGQHLMQMNVYICTSDRTRLVIR